MYAMFYSFANLDASATDTSLYFRSDLLPTRTKIYHFIKTYSILFNLISNLFEPSCQVSEALSAGNTKDNQNAHCIFIEKFIYRSESLLSSSVPYLKVHLSLVYLNSFGYKLNPNRRVICSFKEIIDIPVNNIRFSYTTLT